MRVGPIEGAPKSNWSALALDDVTVATDSRLVGLSRQSRQAHGATRDHVLRLSMSRRDSGSAVSSRPFPNCDDALSPHAPGLSGIEAYGGSFPTTSAARTTSIGSLAIRRFLQPICCQDFF
jgi:hypothetical protein